MAYTSWDRPVTDAELDAFWGTEKPEPADTVPATLACSAIRAIPAHRFTPAVAVAILAALNARLDAIPLKSADVIGAVEHIDDAIYFLEEA